MFRQDKKQDILLVFSFNFKQYIHYDTKMSCACACMRAKSLQAVFDSAILWMVACQAPLSMGFSRREYSSRLSCPSPGVFPNSRIEPTSLKSPALAGSSLPLVPPGKPRKHP